MKHTLYRITFSVFLFSLIITGCQKDIKDTGSINADVQSSDSRTGHQTLRLVESASEFGTETYEYNKKGLLEKWQSNGWGLFVHEYDKWGRLKISRLLTTEGAVFYTIYFFYNNKGLRYHEKWYQGETDVLVDEVFYEFDRKGRGVKTESILGYKVITKWTNDDNIRSWTLYVNNIIAAKAEYTYGHKLKNPFSAIPGLDFAYPYYNGFFFANKHYSTSESFYAYDENGVLIESYPQDPTKTIVRRGPNGYVGSSDFFDEASQDFIHFVFTYEKGKGGYHFGECKNKARRSWEKHMRRDGKKSFKEKLRDFRNDIR